MGVSRGLWLAALSSNRLLASHEMPCPSTSRLAPPSGASSFEFWVQASAYFAWDLVMRPLPVWVWAQTVPIGSRLSPNSFPRAGGPCL